LGIKILILASVVLIAIRLIFEWDSRNVVWIEGTSILIVTLIVTIISSFTEFRISRTIMKLKDL
jgi:hypothetical protein